MGLVDGVFLLDAVAVLQSREHNPAKTSLPRRRGHSLRYIHLFERPQPGHHQQCHFPTRRSKARYRTSPRRQQHYIRMGRLRNRIRCFGPPIWPETMLRGCTIRTSLFARDQGRTLQVCDRKMAPLVPFPWRQRTFIADHQAEIGGWESVKEGY